MVFVCSKCGETFEADGLQVIIHDQSVGRVCPACLAGARTIHLVIVQEAPGKPFTIKHTEFTE
jgi:DNA-directed RNA polymerase subunit RPC12/RpoP